MNLVKEFADFFNLTDVVRLYFPGLRTSVVGYEESTEP